METGFPGLRGTRLRHLGKELRKNLFALKDLCQIKGRKLYKTKEIVLNLSPCSVVRSIISPFRGEDPGSNPGGGILLNISLYYDKTLVILNTKPVST